MLGKASSRGTAPHRGGHPGQREQAVSDVVGSVLLIAITIIATAAFGIVLFAFDPGQAEIHTNLVLSIDPGAGGTWGTGDEQVRVVHAGGDPLDASRATVSILVGSTRTTLTGASQLGSTWSDGQLRIGETWTRTLNIPSNVAVSLDVISTQAGNSKSVASTDLVSNAVTTTNPCATDHAAPVVSSWTQVPLTITATTTGAISVTAQLTDSCWGVNPNIVPDLLWRINPGSNPPAFTDQGPMAAVGQARWAGSVPAQSWSTLVGKRLEYYVGPVGDLGGNVGQSDTQSSLIVTDCASDATPPTVSSFTQSPLDVTSLTTGPVTVTLVVTDNCSGVDEATAPTLQYRFNGGTDPAFVPATMTHTAAGTWTGTIPSQSWNLLVNKVIDYYATGFKDVNGNVAATTTLHDTIQAVATPWYVSSNTATTGTVSNFANAKSASDSGAEATILEGANPAGTVTQIFAPNGPATASSGWTFTSGSLQTAYSTSDSNWALYAGSASIISADDAHRLQAPLADPPTLSGVVSSVQIKAEVSINPADTNDKFWLEGCVTGLGCTGYGTTSPNTGGVNTGTTDVTLSYDVTLLRPGGGTWTLTDLQNLEAVVAPQQQSTSHGTWRVNLLYVQVSYVSTTYSMNVRFDWNTAPLAGSTYTLNLQYRTAGGDSFLVNVWDGSAYHTRGAVLSSSSPTSWTYALTPAEVTGSGTGGNPQPRIQFVDLNGSSTAQATLALDWARVDIV